MKQFVAVILLFCLIATPIFAQQSKSGPKRPDGMDLRLIDSKSSQVLIKNVPAYLWRHGCGPTAAGMVIGYWDSQGYPDLVPGDASTQTAAVNAMIADDGGNPSCDNAVLNHYTDYACPVEWSTLFPDKSELGGVIHQNNCLADFMLTSRSSELNQYGWSWFIHVAQSLTEYVNMIYPHVEVHSENIRWADYSWEQYKEEIDNNRPVVLLVDEGWHSNSDHFVPGIGYDDETMEYAVYDEWDTKIHWYRWQQNTPGTEYGVYGVTTFSLPVKNGGGRNGGDVDGNGRLDIEDVTYLINYQFKNGPDPDPMDVADVNADSAVDIRDLDYLIEYLFHSGPAPLN